MVVLMENITLIYGLESFLIDEEIKKLSHHFLETDGPINQYNLTETSITDLLMDASTVSLLEPKKVIIGYEALFMTGSTRKVNINHDLDALAQYIDNPNPNTLIILVVASEHLDERKKIVKIFKNKRLTLEKNKLNDYDLKTYIKNIFLAEHFKIDNHVIQLLLNRVGDNLYILNSECDKLLLYKWDEKQIDEEDVLNITTKGLDNDIFCLVDAIVKNDIKQSLEIYHSLLKLGEEPIKIIVLLANQFRLMYQTKRLYQMGYSEHDTALKLSVHPYRIKLAAKQSYQYSQEALLNLLSSLGELDMLIKTGKVDKNIGLEMFILNL